jgi:hypothetical protein
MAKKDGRYTMQVGDHVLVRDGPRRRVLVVARVEVPHAPERAFLSKSGASYSIGVTIWKSDYVWNEKRRMWISKH